MSKIYKISAFVITFNEEDNIEKCLNSLQFCDEIVVIDSFSTDKTVEISKKLGAKVIQRKWSGYVDQKQFGLTSCSNEWVLNIDADEVVAKELREDIVLNLEKEDNSYNGYEVNRVVFYLDRWWRSGGWYPEYRVRFFRKSATKWGGIDPHEKPIVSGKIGRLAGELEHYTYTDLEDQLKRLDNFSTISAKQAFESGKKVNGLSILIKPLTRFIKFYFIKLGFKEGVPGLIVALAESNYTFMKYAKLWQYHHSNRDSK